LQVTPGSVGMIYQKETLDTFFWGPSQGLDLHQAFTEYIVSY